MKEERKGHRKILEKFSSTLADIGARRSEICECHSGGAVEGIDVRATPRM